MDTLDVSLVNGGTTVDVALGKFYVFSFVLVPPHRSMFVSPILSSLLFSPRPAKAAAVLLLVCRA